MSNMLELKNITKIYNNERNNYIALDRIDITFNNNGLYLLEGESGSGKTTLLKIISGQINYDEGSIKFNNEKLDLNLISYVNQDINFPKNYLVKEILEFLKRKNKTNEINYNKIIEITNLKSLLNNKIFYLSGGEKQRLEIAISLLLDKQIFILDEPTANLDDKSKLQLLNILIDIAKEKLVILSTNDIFFLDYKKDIDNIIKIQNKKIIMEKDNKENLDNKNLSCDSKLNNLTNKDYMNIAHLLIKRNYPKYILFVLILFIMNITYILFLNKFKINDKITNTNIVSIYKKYGGSLDFDEYNILSNKLNNFSSTISDSEGCDLYYYFPKYKESAIISSYSINSYDYDYKLESDEIIISSELVEKYNLDTETIELFNNITSEYVPLKIKKIIKSNSYRIYMNNDLINELYPFINMREKVQFSFLKDNKFKQYENLIFTLTDSKTEVNISEIEDMDKIDSNSPIRVSLKGDYKFTIDDVNYVNEPFFNYYINVKLNKDIYYNKILPLFNSYYFRKNVVIKSYDELIDLNKLIENTDYEIKFDNIYDTKEISKLYINKYILNIII